MHVNARALIERSIDHGVELLIQTRNKPEEDGTCLELPGGRVEEYESLVDALRREVCEETGLELTEIQGLDTKIDTQAQGSNVECLQPFAVYQTTHGPVDSMGVYFRCKAQGEVLEVGDGTEQIRWVCVRELAHWLQEDIDRFSWVDRAGLVFYLKYTEAW
jgi:8-oxo-dGTP diphosphatase